MEYTKVLMPKELHKQGKCGLDTWNFRKQIHEDPINIFCHEPATERVIGIDGKPLRGKVCVKHRKEMEILLQATNHLVTSKVGRN